MSEEQKIRVVIADDQELVRAGFAMVIGSQPSSSIKIYAFFKKISAKPTTLYPTS